MLASFYYTPLLYGLLILLLVLLVAALVVGYELLRRDFRKLLRGDKTAESLERTTAIEQQMNQLRTQLESAAVASQRELDRLWTRTDGTVNAKLDKAGEAVRQVTESLAAVTDASQRIVQIGSQLAGLSDALRLPPPGGAGNGAVWLADLLGQMLPPQHYQLNVSLDATGRPVDAAVRIGQHRIVIDAGFPVSPTGSNGDGPDVLARRHVDRIAAECIRPEFGTVDFALMYLPTEGLYYDLVIRASHEPNSLSNYALSQRVIPVSPNTLYAYLYTIVLGLRGLQIEQQAERIIGRLGQMRSQFERFTESFRSLGSHLNHAAGRFDQADRQLTRLAARMDDALASEGELPGLAASAEAVGGLPDPEHADAQPSLLSEAASPPPAAPAAPTLALVSPTQPDIPAPPMPESPPAPPPTGRPNRRRRRH